MRILSQSVAAILLIAVSACINGCAPSRGSFTLYTSPDGVKVVGPAECHYWPGVYQGDKEGVIVICRYDDGIYQEFFIQNLK